MSCAIKSPVNPWENDPATTAFGHTLKQLLASSLALQSNDSAHSENGWEDETASCMTEKPQLDLIDRLCAADDILQKKRASQLNKKLDQIHSEVAEILSAKALIEMRDMLNTISSNIESMSSNSILENILVDLDRKRDEICVDADVIDQRKVIQVITFIDGLRAMDAKTRSGEAKVSSNRATDKFNSNEVIGEGRQEGSEREVADLKQALVDVTTRYDGVAQSAESLREQYAKLKEFHVEFRSHIFRGF